MNLEQQLSMALAPCEPGPEPMAAVMARLSGVRPTPSNDRRPGRGRVIIISSLVALAAAAGMLATRLLVSSAQVSVALPEDAGAVAAVPAESAPVESATEGLEAAAMPVPTTQGATQDQATRPAPPPPDGSTFTVYVRPLQLDTNDAATQSRIQQYFAALLDELTLVPGLVLVDPDAPGAGTTPADFRITVTGDDMREAMEQPGLMWQVTVRAESWRDDAYRPELRGSTGSGGTLKSVACPQVPGLPPSCGPAADAARAVTSLLKVFPDSAALSAYLAARNRVAAQAQAASGEKTQVIKVDLLNPPAVTQMDASVIHTILERIATVQVPASRVVLWTGLRGQQQPELLQGLLQALREEPADDVRGEIITQLALQFAEIPAVRAVLANVAASESRALSRHIAVRALSGDAPWRDYVVATVHDATLPPEQRLEPLTWMIGAKQLDAGIDATFNDVVSALLEGDRTRELAELMLHRLKETSNMLDSVAGLSLVARISAVDHPAVPRLLVACFDTVPSDLTLRLLATRSGDPRVREKLEAIATADSDPKLRQQARSLLRQGAPAPAATGN